MLPFPADTLLEAAPDMGILERAVGWDRGMDGGIEAMLAVVLADIGV